MLCYTNKMLSTPNRAAFYPPPHRPGRLYCSMAMERRRGPLSGLPMPAAASASDCRCGRSPFSSLILRQPALRCYYSEYTL